MKVFVIGGVTVKRGEPGYDLEIPILRQSMEALGAELVKHGHEAVVCSPFPDSADHYVLQGIANSSTSSQPVASIHYPELPDVKTALQKHLELLGLELKVREFPCSVGAEPTSEEGLEYAWLFAQLNAMDSSAGVVVVGGKPSGSLNLLLHLAKARNKGVLPLTFLGGGALNFFKANRWSLGDLLHEDLSILNDRSVIPSVPTLLETLLTGSRPGGEQTFFISYARARPQEADYVETLLRRRGYIVYRDENDFEPSAETQTEINMNIKRASVFIALWGRDYACSPWCFDEFEIGLERQDKGRASLWILCIDDTRMVPKAARQLNYYQVGDSREKLEGKILFLLGKLEK